MYSEKTQAAEQAAATLTANTSAIEGVASTGAYTVECFDADGNLKWSDVIKNLVVTQGKNNMLDEYFEGSGYTPAWYLGLVDGATSPTYAAGNTLASHSGWTENTGYSGNRPAVSWLSASAGSKSTSATSFAINASGTIAGAFMCTVATGTSGILYSAGNFTGGSRIVASGDTLNVTYTATLT